MGGRVTALALAMEASDAYDHELANMAVVDGVIAQLAGDVDIEADRLYELTERLHQLLHTNRTAPAMVRIMAYANAARISEQEAERATAGWLERRSLRRERARFMNELRSQIASTLDALIDEPY